jgi:anti-sigma regulatory factor (Ser/Thr protein kinase)
VTESAAMQAVEFPRHPAVSAAARRVAHDWCDARLISEDTSRDVVLVVSELVTNALLHGQGRITLDLDVDEDDVVVQVSDKLRQGPPIVAQVPDVLSVFGRGWLMTQSIARTTGVNNTLHGKTVWARIPISRD